MEWAKQLEADSATVSAAKGTQSTLIKRGTKDRAAADDEGVPAAKKAKVEGSSEDLVKSHYEKGTLAKVNPLLSLFSTFLRHS